MANSPSLAAQNKAALDYFVQAPVHMDMISYLASKAAAVIRCDATSTPGTSGLPTPPATPPGSRDLGLPSLEDFIISIVQQSHVQVPTLMPALVYLSRLRSKLPPVAQGIPSTVHRIFLAALILSAKNLNDSSPKNKHWARYTAVPGYPDFGFTNTEVNLMEKQMLYLLDWDLRITNEDLYFHFEPFLAPIRVKQQQQAERKVQAMMRTREREQAKVQTLRKRQQSQSSISHMASVSQLNLPHVLSQASHLTRSRGLYDSPQTLSTASSYSPAALPSSTSNRSVPHSRSSSLHPTSRSSSRAPTRTPSLSPPSRCESSASYNSSLASASCSPASFVGPQTSSVSLNTAQYAYAYPTKPQEAKILSLPYYDAEYFNPANQYGYMHQDAPEVVHIQPTYVPQEKMLPARPVQAAAPVHDLEDGGYAAKPAAKKLKTSAGNLLSRFLGGHGIGAPAATVVA